MPRTANISTRDQKSSFTQADNARQPRLPGFGKPRRPYSKRASNNVVDPEPVTDPEFTWARVVATQCVAQDKYSTAADGNESNYFTTLTAQHVLNIAAGNNCANSVLLKAMTTEIRLTVDTDELSDVLHLHSVEYGQLLRLGSPPDISGRPPPGNDLAYEASTFENFDVMAPPNKTKQYVLAPRNQGGWYAEVASALSAKYKLTLTFVIKLEDFTKDQHGREDANVTYALTLKFCRRGDANVMHGCQTSRDDCIRLQVGHIDELTENFVPWITDFTAAGKTTATYDIMLADKGMATELFDQTRWPTKPTDGPLPDDLQGGFEDLQGDFAMDDSRQRYTFKTVNDVLCILAPSAGDEDELPIRTGNFTIPVILQQYQHTDEGESPLIKVLLRHRLEHGPPDGHTVYLKSESLHRSPDLRNAKYLDAEMLLRFTEFKTPQCIRQAFAEVHICFKPESINPEQLTCYLNSIPQPHPITIISRWGKQPDGWWVMQNIAFKGGVLMSVEDSGHAIAPGFFNKNPNCPMPSTDFPRITIIPFDHVRFMLGYELWNRLMPAFFVNNEIPAKFVFAMAVLGMHADRLWKGESGVGHGCPVGWFHSPEQGSGKTEAMLLAHSMLGLYNRSLWAGDATKSVTFEATSMDSCLMKFIDDYVPSDRSESKIMQQLIRSIYDCTQRAVTGKLRTPHSSISLSSNGVINCDDKAFQSRMITILFKALKVPDDHVDDPLLYSEYATARKLASCLAPDMAQIGLWNGSLDREAIQDWASYLQAALGKKRDRNLNEWAKIAYIMSLLNYAFGASNSKQVAMVDWMMVTVTRATHELINHAGVLDQFVIAVLQIKDDMGVNVLGPNPDKVLFWHNMRTTAVPALHSSTARYWSFRVGKVCHVIKALTGKVFKETAVMGAVDDSKDAKSGKALFFDTDKHGWPIKKSIIPDIGDAMAASFQDVPLLEDELLEGTLTRQRCIFISETLIEQIRTSLCTGARLDTDHTQIIITSASATDTPSYNFYKSVTGMDWYGYRSLKQGSFSTFCGATNQMHPHRVVSSVEDELLAQGFEMSDVFKPSVMAKWFGYDVPDINRLGEFPVAYTKMPFHFRDEVQTHYPTPKTAATKRALAPDSDDDEVVDVTRRRRASPTNMARYPRPAGQTHYTDHTRALYIAGLAGPSTQPHGRKISDEDEKSVR